MCRGTSDTTATEADEAQTHASKTPGSEPQHLADSTEQIEDLCSEGAECSTPTTAASVTQDFPPLQKQVPLPMLALQSRLHSHSAPPTWAAWLPKGMQRAAGAEIAQTMQTDTPATSNWCEDSPPMMLANMTYASQDGCYVNACESTAFVSMDGVLYQPMLVPTECVNDICADVEGAYCVNYTGTEMDQEYMQEVDTNACAFYNGSQMQQQYIQFDEPAGGLQQAYYPRGPLTGKVWKLSRDARGCRQVQDAFDGCTSDEERMALTSELVGHVWESLKCQHANHVMQKCISTISPLAAQFVIDELSQRGPGGVAQAARHRFGCRIIERLLEHCSAEQVSCMVDELVADTAALSSHTYGNYVIQHLLEHCPHVVASITAILDQNVANVSADGYAGAVIGKALGQPNNQAAHSLANHLLKDPDFLAIMACSRWGHLGVKHALQLADPSTCQKACTELTRRSGRLRSSRYGRLVTSSVAELQALQASWKK